MALFSSGLNCPCVGSGLTLPCSQVGAGRHLSSSCNGSGRGLGLWPSLGLAPGSRSQRCGMAQVTAMGGKKEVGKGGENEKRELKLEAADMLELEFGRLLGEPRQATLAKVIGRKVNPELSFIEIEKKPLKMQRSSPGNFSESDFSQLLNQEGRPSLRPNVAKRASSEDLPGLVRPPPHPGLPVSQVHHPTDAHINFSESDFSQLLNQEGRPRAQVNVAKSAAWKAAPGNFEDLPGLVQPPPRPGLPVFQESRRVPSVKPENGHTNSQDKKAIPLVTFGPNGFAAQTRKQREEEDYRGLLRKPKIGSEDSYKPSWPTSEIIQPMVMGKSKRSENVTDDALLRRPVPGDMNVAKASTSVVDKDVQSMKKRDVKAMPSSRNPSFGNPIQGLSARPSPAPAPDMSEERFARLLELAGSSDSERDQQSLSDTSSLMRVATVGTSSKMKASPRPRSKAPNSQGAKPPLQIVENKELNATVETITSFSSDYEVSIPSYRSPVMDPEKNMLKDEAESATSRPSKTKPISLTHPILTVAERPLITPSPSNASPTSAEGGIPQVFNTAVRPATKPAMPSFMQEKPTKRPAIASQKQQLRPPTFPSSSLSPSTGLETVLTEREESTSPEETTQEASQSATILEVGNLPLSSSVPSNAENQMRVEKIVELKESDVKPNEMAKVTDAQPERVRPILRLIKKVIPVTPVRQPKQFFPTAPNGLKSELVSPRGDGKPSSDRLAGWSDEVKAAVRRSEAALQRDDSILPTESDFDSLLQQPKPDAKLIQLKPPVPPPTPSQLLPTPIEVTIRQLSATRSAIPSPKPDGPIQDDTPLVDTRTPSREEEDQNWARAEALRESRLIEEVVFVGANAGGMLLKFGSLIGFLPAWELGAKRRPPSFRTWMQENGFSSKQSVASVPSEKDEKRTTSNDPEGIQAVSDEAENRKLLQLYRGVRENLLSALVGETANVVAVSVERERRQLRFSEKSAEGEGQELAQRKAQLMANLKVGDVVTCTVKKVTSFGAFVELQGIPALIHISELSWNRITDPTKLLDIGQEVEVKVCRLDRFLQRINLSLKQMQLDPLRETLESLVSADVHEDAIDVGTQKVDKTTEIPELNGVIKRLEEYKGIDSVRKGRRIRGTALAPTFQVYLSDQLDEGFKLLARSGNTVEEVFVQTSLDRESMKDAIRQCTFSEN